MVAERDLPMALRVGHVSDNHCALGKEREAEQATD